MFEKRVEALRVALQVMQPTTNIDELLTSAEKVLAFLLKDEIGNPQESHV